MCPTGSMPSCIRSAQKVAIAFCWRHRRSRIKLLKGVPNRPPIYVEMRAYGLHTHEGGAIGACEAACGFIRRPCSLTTTRSGPPGDQPRRGPLLPARPVLRLARVVGIRPSRSTTSSRFIKRVHAEVGRYTVNGTGERL